MTDKRTLSGKRRADVRRILMASAKILRLDALHYRLHGADAMRKVIRMNLLRAKQLEAIAMEFAQMSEARK